MTSRNQTPELPGHPYPSLSLPSSGKRGCPADSCSGILAASCLGFKGHRSDPRTACSRGTSQCLRSGAPPGDLGWGGEEARRASTGPGQEVRPTQKRRQSCKGAGRQRPCPLCSSSRNLLFSLMQVGAVKELGAVCAPDQTTPQTPASHICLSASLRFIPDAPMAAEGTRSDPPLLVLFRPHLLISV